MVSVIYVSMVWFLKSIFAEEEEDSACEAGFECINHTDCKQYVKDRNLIKTSSKIKDKNELFNKLRSLVCNKKSRKVCCVKEGINQIMLKYSKINHFVVLGLNCSPFPNFYILPYYHLKSGTKCRGP